MQRQAIRLRIYQDEMSWFHVTRSLKTFHFLIRNSYFRLKVVLGLWSRSFDSELSSQCSIFRGSFAENRGHQITKGGEVVCKEGLANGYTSLSLALSFNGTKFNGLISFTNWCELRVTEIFWSSENIPKTVWVSLYNLSLKTEETRFLKTELTA